MRDLLTSAGFELIEAVDGEEGVKLAQSERPDLILMDIQLPVIDGYEATRQIRAFVDLKSIPIIAVTSYALSGDEAKAREAGCNGYVAKPFSPAPAPCQGARVLAGREVLVRKPPLILIADDNEANREILARRLDAHGYELVMAADGEEALNLRAREASRSHLARYHDAQDGRARGLPPLEGRQEPSVHPDHPCHGSGGHQGHRGWLGHRRRRIPDQTGGPIGPGRARSLNSAHQGAARHRQ